ncbi:hypothetical protein MPH_04270 [Macrophomina phaseolina MS6]|uniref:Uncharacterized protein n=1 Tax=Macrophomina phaseolina (strain MS6) TaxID=1126212 RepID=K2RUK9_MACPH|nr:hypothetical protein MPH_04270 [Macrophomina phaseolina MS6]
MGDLGRKTNGYSKYTGKDERWSGQGRDSSYVVDPTQSSNVQPEPNNDPWPEEDSNSEVQSSYGTANQQNYGSSPADGRPRPYTSSPPYTYSSSSDVSPNEAKTHRSAQSGAEEEQYTPRGYAQARSASGGTDSSAHQKETATSAWTWSAAHNKYYYTTADHTGKTSKAVSILSNAH